MVGPYNWNAPLFKTYCHAWDEVPFTAKHSCLLSWHGTCSPRHSRLEFSTVVSFYHSLAVQTCCFTNTRNMHCCPQCAHLWACWGVLLGLWGLVVCVHFCGILSFHRFWSVRSCDCPRVTLSVSFQSTVHGVARIGYAVTVFNKM